MLAANCDCEYFTIHASKSKDISVLHSMSKLRTAQSMNWCLAAVRHFFLELTYSWNLALDVYWLVCKCMLKETAGMFMWLSTFISSDLGCRTRQSKNYRNGCYFTVIRYFLKQQLTWLQYLWKQRVKVYIFTKKIYLICERDRFQLYIASTLRELRKKVIKK